MNSNRLPAFFIGHGSPMNVIRRNRYTEDLERTSSQLPLPQAIVVISAHWLTRGTLITAAENPEQIYDFYGFPPELYQIDYRAPGSPPTAELVVKTVGNNLIKMDQKRGIDHAAWAVLKFLYPRQNIPVLELSLDMEQDPSFHFELGKKLASLRSKGILLIGSGNIVHNLREMEYDEQVEPYDWAVEFDQFARDSIENKNFDGLIHYQNYGAPALRAIPTSEHYLPMLYTLGMMQEDERATFIHESIQNASVSMRSFKVS